MAKSGLKIGTPANDKKNVTLYALRKDMNMQASAQSRMAQGANLNLSTGKGNKNRPFRMVIINGVTVKRYILKNN